MVKCDICKKIDSEKVMFFRKIDFGTNQIARQELDSILEHTHERLITERNRKIRNNIRGKISPIYLPSYRDKYIISDILNKDRFEGMIEENVTDTDYYRICPIVACDQCFHDIGFTQLYRFGTYKIDEPEIMGESMLVSLDMNTRRVLKLADMNEEIFPKILKLPVVITATLSHDILNGTSIKENVFDAIINIAKEVSRYGIEGRRIGTAFIIGKNIKQVRSKQIVLNPFKGYDKIEKMVTNPAIKESIKIFAQFDGVFIISEDGEIESCGTLIYPDEKIELDSGLGSRHHSVAMITKIPSIIGIVVSQSGPINIFKNGISCGEMKNLNDYI